MPTPAIRNRGHHFSIHFRTLVLSQITTSRLGTSYEVIKDQKMKFNRNNLVFIHLHLSRCHLRIRNHLIVNCHTTAIPLLSVLHCPQHDAWMLALLAERALNVSGLVHGRHCHRARISAPAAHVPDGEPGRPGACLQAPQARRGHSRCRARRMQRAACTFGGASHERQRAAQPRCRWRDAH